MKIQFNKNIPNFMIYLLLQIYQVYVFTSLDVVYMSKLQTVIVYPFITSIILTSVYRHIKNKG
jgi:hypothetical protein